MKEKMCKDCGTTENLKTRKMKTGRIFIINICHKCYSKKISETTKEAMSNLSDEKRQKCNNAFLNAWKNKTEKEKQEIINKRIETQKNNPEIETCRREKISNFWENMSNEELNEIKEKRKKIRDNLTKEQKQIESKNKSEAIKKWLYDEKHGLEYWSKKSEGIWETFSEQKQKEIIKLRVEGIKNFWENCGENYKKEFGNRISVTLKNRTEEEIKIWKEKISIAAINNIIRLSKEHKSSISKGEKICLAFIKENIDENVQHQVKYNNWAIDFYLPKYDLYIQYDGDFWHGYLNTTGELEKFPIGRGILGSIERDKRQNNSIKNLIRIRESEFKENPYKLIDKINNF